MKRNTAVTSIWNGLDGLINDKPFMPGTSPARQAVALMELAEQDGERLGAEERRLVISYAEAVRDYRQVSDFINELCDSGHELQFGRADPEMVEYIQREIETAQAMEIFGLASAG